ncbi:MAG: response regulator [Chitinophagaceae bacterium]|nr:response regulator [Chitinophagaceae bacterium]
MCTLRIYHYYYKVLISAIACNLFGITALFCQEYPVKFLGIENGLSNNAVMSIYQDHNGFMWFGTYDGLNRYDGYEFTTFHNVIGDTSSLPNNTIFAIEGDALQQLWVGGQKGASVYNPLLSTFRQLSYKPADRDIILPVSANIHRIKMTSDQHMLIGAQDAGMIIFNKGSLSGRQVVLEEGGVQRYDVTAIEQGAEEGFVWVFIQKKGLYKFNIDSAALTLCNSSITQANSLRYMPGKGLWIGTNNGLFLYNIENNSFSQNFLPSASPVINILIDRDKRLWAATDGSGVFILNNDAAMAVHDSKLFGTALVKSNSVWEILEDKEGRKWIGTLRGGISVIEPEKKLFGHLTYNSSKPTLADNFILSFCEDENQNIWIGTDGAGLRYWNRKDNSYKEYRHTQNDSKSISSNFITCIIRDTRNDIWASTWFNGINRLNASTGKFEYFNCFNPVTGATERNVWLLYEDAQKELWASATNTGSLYRFNRGDNRFELFDETITDLQAITETIDGEFWGGNYSALIKIDRSTKKHSSYAIGYTIRCIYEDKAKNFWIGTQEGGLLLFNRQTGDFARYSVADGLPGNTILRILEDRNGSLWLSTYNGISRFDPSKKAFRNFSISDGLQSNQFSFNAGLALSTGEFLFGGINGWNIFYPDHIRDNKNIPPVFLSGLMVSNDNIQANSSYVAQLQGNQIRAITLPYEKAVVSIDFLALAYTGADKINYAYQLERWDKDWNYVQKSRRANYAKLSEGSYIFKVKATGSDGKWGPETRLLHIQVLPPWYRTWWAYLAGFFAVAGSVFLYNRYTRRQERLKYQVQLVNLEREKDKELAEKQFSIFTNVSHEFRTHLSLIISPLKKQVSVPDNSAENKDIETAYRNSRRLLSLVDQLLLFKKADAGADTLKIASVNVADLCKEVFDCFDYQAKSKKLAYHFTCNAADTFIYGDYEKIEIALFNLLSNAFKFTDEGNIHMYVTETGKDISINIQDTGCGIAAGDMKNIFEKFQQVHSAEGRKTFGFGVGLYLVQHFVTQHGGKVECVSEKDKGTTMTVTLLKGKDHFGNTMILHEYEQKAHLLEELAAFESITDNAGPAIVPVTGKAASEVLSAKKSILIIDDNAEMRKYLFQLFSKEYLVYTANNGTEGLKMADDYVPDIIISDVNMDGLDGVELCIKVKQSPRLSHIPVILLTAVDASEIKLKGVAGGADDYITKPFDDELLMAKIDSTLKNRHHLRKYFLDSITLQHNDLKVPAEYQDFLKKCIEVIEENIDNENFTIKSFSVQMGMSHSALYNKVKAISGQSLNAFIRSIRIRRAAVLMLTGNMNIAQAAFQVGIGDAKYFREQFVKLFGMTPSDYIKKYKHNFNKELNIIKIKE